MDKCRKWTEEEDDFLRKNYSYENKKILIDSLDRTWTSITQRALKKHKMKSGRFWSAEQDAVLRIFYPCEGATGVKERLGLSYATVKRRAVKLGVSADYYFWNEDDTTYVKSNYGHMTYEEIAKAIDKTPNSVQHKVYTLGLENKRDTPKLWTDDEIKLLEKMYVDGKTFKEIEWVFGRDYDSVRHKLKKIEGIDWDTRPIYDGVKFDSHQELDVYKFISSYGIKIKKNKDKFDHGNGSYIPDYIISENIIVEYYGWYYEKNQSQHIESYVLKTHRKNKFYNELEDYDFIAIYPDDLKTNFEGVYDKIRHLIKNNSEEKEV